MTESQFADMCSNLVEQQVLGFVPVNVFCDNKFIFSLIKSRAHSSKGKHIDVNHQYFQDIMENGEIKVDFIPSNEVVAY